MSVIPPSRWLSVPPLASLEGWGCRTLGAGVVEDGISHPHLITSSLSGSHPHAQLFPFLHQGESSSGGGSVAPCEGSDSTHSSFAGLLQLPLCGLEDLQVAEACHQPLVPELSHHPNTFKMETNQSVLCALRRDDWMVSIDLKDAYLQIPVHPDSRQFLQFMAFEVSYQFRALCFCLSTAPQVFTRVMASSSRDQDAPVPR